MTVSVLWNIVGVNRFGKTGSSGASTEMDRWYEVSFIRFGTEG
jgi:hypothetical protein